MKTFFVRTPWEPLHIGFYKVASFEPLQFEYLSKSIRDISDITLWDLWYQKENKMIKAVEKEKPELMVFSVSTVHLYSVTRITKFVKKVSPNTHIIVGGDLPHLAPGFFVDKDVDLISVGAGGELLRDIALKIKNAKAISGIPNTIEVKDGYLIENERRYEYSSIDKFGLPDRELTASYRHKFHLYHFKPMASSLISKGCWNRCNFCSTWMKDGLGSVNRREIDSIIEDLKTIKEKWVFFSDDNMFANGHQIKKIVDRIEKEKIDHHYIIEATADDILKNKELIKKWAKLGLRLVLIGLESPFNEDLKAVEKPARNDENENTMQFLRECGVDIIASFILFPHWRYKQFNGLWRYIKKHRLFWVHLQCYTPFPGTKLYVEEFNNIRSHNLDLFDLEHMVMKTEIPLVLWYLYRFWFQLKIFMPWRGFDQQVQRRIPLNPLNQLYRAITHFSFDCLIIIAHHLFKAPKWQPRELEKIMCGKNTKELLNLKPYKKLSNKKQKEAICQFN